VTTVVRNQLAGAGLVAEVGGGYQPALEGAISAAGLRAAVLELYPTVGGRVPQFWLDPERMADSVRLVADQLARLNPAAASVYRDKARDLEQSLKALSIDYRTTLSDCSLHTMVTTDAQFDDAADRYGISDHALATLATTTPGVVAAVSTIRAARVSVIFDETLADNTLTDQAAAVARVRRETLDTISGPPAGGWPAGSTYQSLMESNLTRLARGLQCVPAGG